MLAKGFPFAQQHFEDVSKTVGWPLAIPESVINDLGYTALSQQKTQDAIALFQRNVEANPNSANAYDSLAEGYAKAGMWKDAARASAKAAKLAIEFDHPEALTRQYEYYDPIYTLPEEGQQWWREQVAKGKYLEPAGV